MQALIFFFFLFLLIRRLLYIQISAQHGKRKRGKTVHIPAIHHGGKLILGIPVFSHYLFRVKKEDFCCLKKSTHRARELTLFFPNHLQVANISKVTIQWKRRLHERKETCVESTGVLASRLNLEQISWVSMGTQLIYNSIQRPLKSVQIFSLWWVLQLCSEFFSASVPSQTSERYFVRVL